MFHRGDLSHTFKTESSAPSDWKVLKLGFGFESISKGPGDRIAEVSVLTEHLYCWIHFVKLSALFSICLNELVLTLCCCWLQDFLGKEKKSFLISFGLLLAKLRLNQIEISQDKTRYHPLFTLTPA